MAKLVSFLKSALTMIFATLVLFGVLEVLARFAYPEFKGHVHSATKTLGVNYFLDREVPIRIPAPGSPIRLDRPVIIVLGDSISHGYGMAYEDIYWVRLSRMMQLELGPKAPEFISLSYYGNNLQDSVIQLDKFLGQHHQADVREIIYQFNFNDVVPEAYGRAALHAQEKPPAQSSPVVAKLEAAVTPSISSASPKTTPAVDQGDRQTIGAGAWAKEFAAAWRSEYMNYSVFLRVAQHYAGMLMRKTTGDCVERGLNALGPYTWTYGSRKFADESEVLWRNFETALTKLKQEADSRGAKLVITVSPLLYDIDRSGAHPHYNYLNFDFSCATIDPRARLVSIGRSLGVNVYDPTDYMRRAFETRVIEGNFTPFFVTADENHITSVAASLMAEYLYVELNKPSAR